MAMEKALNAFEFPRFCPGFTFVPLFCRVLVPIRWVAIVLAILEAFYKTDAE